MRVGIYARGLDRHPASAGDDRLATGDAARPRRRRGRRTGRGVHRLRLPRGKAGPPRPGPALRRRRNGRPRRHLVPVAGSAGPLLRLPDPHPRPVRPLPGAGSLHRRPTAGRPARAATGADPRRHRRTRTGQVRRPRTTRQAVSGTRRRGALHQGPLRLPTRPPHSRPRRASDYPRTRGGRGAPGLRRLPGRRQPRT